jgi:glycosyltransferase involved in cell wall biosynthesis
MKIDLHVHSRFSTRPSQWVLQKLGCPESFTSPTRLYRLALERGMDMVTITDHNTLDGALSIAHLPQTFVSEEITTYFPDVRCKVHVLALDITESQHQDIQKVRENIHDLVGYLQSQDIHHVLAHPLYAINDRLSLDHFEQLLLLFKNFELNGTRDAWQNRFLTDFLAGLTREDMELLADRHGFEPAMDQPWVKNLTGGSDDHSAVNIARMHTEVAGANDVREFLEGMEAGRSRPLGTFSTPRTMAHNLYAIAYQFYKNRFQAQRFVNKDICIKFVDRFLDTEPQGPSNVVDRLQAFWRTRSYLKGRHKEGSSMLENVRREAAGLILGDPGLSAIAKGTGGLPAQPGDEWFRFANRATNKVMNRFATTLLGQVSGANVFDVFGSLGQAGALYTILAPYFVSYPLFTKDRRFCTEVANHFDALRGRPVKKHGDIKVGHFTDTFFEINGVARTLQRMVRLAGDTGKGMTVITCDPGDKDHGPGVRNFEPVGVFDLPEYPDLKLFYPPVLEMLDYAFEQGFTHIHSATPGPIGLVGLLVSRILKLPFYGTYHTQVPQYTYHLTKDDAMEELMWRYMIWFHNQMDVVWSPSESTGKELIAKGVHPDKVRVYPRGVDIGLYHPANRNGFLSRYGISGGVNLLYVGRVSREKNLEQLVRCYRLLVKEMDNVNLVVAGNGPYLEEMQQELAGTPARFAGYVEGEELAALYASCDIFAFPSATDTFGNVVLEAQASGIPVIVTDQGGPCENVIHGDTGLVVEAGDEAAFLEALKTLVKNPQKRIEMGAAARLYMEGRSFESAFETTWEMYRMAV